MICDFMNKNMNGIEKILESENMNNECAVMPNRPVYNKVSGSMASIGGSYRNCGGKGECATCKSYNC